MTIHAIQAKKFTIPLAHPFSYFTATLKNLDYALVVVSSSSNQQGIGEAALAWDVTGETQEGALASVALVSDMVKNARLRTVKDIEHIMQNVDAVLAGNTGAKCAIESALFDVLGKHKKKPIYKLLGGKPRQWVGFHKTFSFEESQYDLRGQMSFLIDQGVKLFKFKVGSDTEKEARIIFAARKRFPWVDIVLDANQAWADYRDALEFLKKIKQARISWIEQPLKARDFSGLQRMRRKTSIKIMADESCHGLFDLQVLKKYNAIDLINIKLAKCGGLLPARDMISFCEKHSIKYMLGDMIQSPIGTAYNIHAAMLGNFITHDLTPPQRFKKEIAYGLEFDDFKVRVPQKPGLGVNLAS